MKRVIGMGGVFFKSKDPAALRAWYKKHLGIDSETWGAVFKWNAPEIKEQNKEIYNVWSPFQEDTTYLAPSGKPFMINYIVADLDQLVEALKTEGIALVGEPVTEEFGKFAWIMDPENNKIELWEPA